MTKPQPIGPILRRTFGPETARLRIRTAEEERRRSRPTFRSGLAVAFDLDRRLRALGYHRGGVRLVPKQEAPPAAVKTGGGR